MDPNQGGTTSVFGERLDYTKPQYRDVWAMVLFYLQIVVVIAVCIYFWVDSDGFSVDGGFDISSSEVTAVYVTLIVCLFIGVIFGFIWLQILKKFASVIIKFMLFANVAMWGVVIIIGVSTGETGLMIIGALFFVLSGLYMWCVWSRIPFSSVLLKISSTIISKYPGTVCVALFLVIINIVWFLIWGSSVAAYVFYQTNQDSDTIPGGILFLFFVSLFWGEEVWRNSTHTTACGVAATWYFSDPRDVGNPTGPAFKRTMTTSFGSVCFGSLIVAILEAIRAMINNARQQNNGNACLLCVVECCVACIENLVRYFNSYAYAQCAIYGTNFIESSKNTWQLFEKSGIKAIINDDLTGMALFLGALVGLIVSGIVGYLVCWSIYDNGDDGFCYGVGSIGGFLGLFLCFQVIYVTRSAIICLFVCWAEDPAALKQTHASEYAELTGVRPDLGETSPLVDNNFV
mmetsp:Transcript_25368/g.30912  ORF Transcript_25368/g.30912 Transcript_25368/m.30912 type:complete len:459 (+) Transcript_25368:51-1427(+)